MADYDIGEAFEVIEEELISSVMQNLRQYRAEETADGIQWERWQAEQLKALEKYKSESRKKYSERFAEINGNIPLFVENAYEAGRTAQEKEISEAVENGLQTQKSGNGTVNADKIQSLAETTAVNLQKVEGSMLRMANDKYSKIISNVQAFADEGMSYEAAVDRASKDFLCAGLNCVEYKNGARVNAAGYADMAVKTANERARMHGEGEKRAEYGINTVLVGKRGEACPKCIEFTGRVFIDNVWGGGTAAEAKSKGYPLLSEAMAGGLYHPNCKDHHTTYFEGVSTIPKPMTKADIAIADLNYKLEQERKYAERQAKKYDRLAKYSLHEDNQRKYSARAQKWHDKAENIAKTVAKTDTNGIIEMYRKKGTHRRISDSGSQIIDKATYHRITNPAIRRGADIRIADGEWLEHLREQESTAVTIGDIIFFRPDATVSDVLEEVHHFYQNKIGLNNQYGNLQRTILNEIDAKQYLLTVTEKYHIPSEEVELTKQQLESYQRQMSELKERGEWID